MLEAPYTFKARVEEETQKTNPEELLGAADAACFAMFLSGQLARAGFTQTEVHATANVTLSRGEAGLKIEGILLDVEGKVPGISEVQFKELAEKSKAGCPVSVALAVPITLQTKLLS